MKKIKLLLVFMLLIFVACEDFVNNVDPFIDRVVDESLNLDSQIPSLVTGMITETNQQLAEVLLMADGLSDAMVWDQRLPNATYSSFRLLEYGDIDEVNSSTNGTYYDIHYARFLADDLVERITTEISSSASENAVHGLYNGNLYGGYLRYLLGTYYGRNGDEGGATIDNSAFIPTSDLYAAAINRWTTAMNLTSDANDIKILHSLIGRCYFLLADYANATTHLDLGLVEGDDPWFARYDPINNENYYRGQASSSVRIQWRLDDRFGDYVVADPTEANRIKFIQVADTSNMEEQTIYVLEDNGETTPIPIIDWKEVYMMRAEMTVRGTASGDPLTLINDIRAAQNVSLIPGGTVIDLDAIYDEADKELLCLGLRLVYQRRFDRFHIPSYGRVYFYIPQQERIKNPNYN